LTPDLEVIDRRVIQPTADYIELIKTVDKFLTKRSHKLIDYDRYRDNHQKLKARTDRNVSDEKKLANLEIQLDQATRDFNNINNLLKSQLPVFLQLRVNFIDPCFLTFYYYQIKIYDTLTHSFRNIVNQNYDPNEPILAGYHKKAIAGVEMLEGLSVRRKPGAPRPSGEYSETGGDTVDDEDQTNSNSSLEKKNPMVVTNPFAANAAKVDPSASFQATHPPPPYQPTPSTSYTPPTNQPGNPFNKPPPSSITTPATTSLSSSAASAPMKPPVATKPSGLTYSSAGGMAPSSNSKSTTSNSNPSLNTTSSSGTPPNRFSNPTSTTTSLSTPQKKYVIALYDFAAQAPGDLSFKKDDRIELVSRTPDVNDWWTGKLGSVTGVFPGNYVAEI